MDTDSDLESMLPSEEREILQTALQQGYFEIPRRVTLVDLADELDISDHEAKRRLASGMATVLSESDSLLPDRSDDSHDGTPAP